MKRKVIALAILLVLLLGVVGIAFASELCSTCKGFGTVCPFNSNHRIDLPGKSGEPECPTCGISFSKFNCKPCGGKGRK